MKKVCLILMLFVLVLAGCKNTEPATVATVSPGPVSVTVDSVDGFLEAIGPDTEIILEAGYYDLSTASDYGMETENPFYDWIDIGDGYQLTIEDVDMLTIRANGDAMIVTTPRYANVIHFSNCFQTILDDFMAGHTQGGECAGGVIHLQNCEQAQLENLSLYGCGTTGVRIDSCKDITVRSSKIYGCSSNGIQADQSDRLLVTDCNIHDIGEDRFAAGQVFWIRQCSDVSITKCSVYNNQVLQLMNCQPAAGIELRQCEFIGNRMQSCVFAINGGGMVMEECTFEDNIIRNWFDSEDGTILDGIGKTWTEDMLDVWYGVPAEPLNAGERTEVVVSTIDELIAAIGSDMEIILKDGEYDLSTAKDYGTGRSHVYYWSEEFDGPALNVYGVDNLVIRSESGDPKKCSISAVPRYANIFSFKTCTNITVSGITAGHTVEPGYCMGGVLYYEDCDNVLVSNCCLYGCGILGVQAEYCSGVSVTGCEIYECSYGGIQMGHCSGIRIDNCAFRDLGGEAISFYECKDVTVDAEKVNGNARLSY